MKKLLGKYDYICKNIEALYFKDSRGINTYPFPYPYPYSLIVKYFRLVLKRIFIKHSLSM